MKQCNSDRVKKSINISKIIFARCLLLTYLYFHYLHCTKKFSIKDLFSKCDQIRRICGFGHILKKSLMEYFSLCALLRLLTAFFSLKNCCKSLKNTCESLIRHYNCICRGGFSDCRARGRIYPQGPYLNIFINQVILQILFRQIFNASKLCTVLPI